MPTPLSKKLGIKEAQAVWTVNSPDEFDSLLAPLPDGAKVIEIDLFQPETAPFSLCILFVGSREELFASFSLLFPMTGPKSMIWISWPKKASKVPTDLSFDVVQKLGLSRGLVDNKVCSISDVWSAVRFVVRLENREDWSPEQF